MQKSILVQVIGSLDKKEIRELNKWLRSPAHNQREDVIRLFEYLNKISPESPHLLDKTTIWKNIFPNLPYDDSFIRQVMFFLLKSVEEYLTFSSFLQDEVQYNLKLSKIYRKRNLEKPYKNAYKSAMDSLENQPLRNDWYLKNKFFLAQEEYEYNMGVSQNAPVGLQEVANALEKWFLEERLRVSNDMLAHHRIYQKITYDHGLLNQILMYVEEEQFLDEPAIAMYYNAYRAITNPHEELFFSNFEQLIYTERDKFQHSEVRTLYLAALNYCVPKVNQGRQDFYRKTFELYKNGVESGILIENGGLSRYTFLNSVSSALKINEFNWAENFIQKFQSYLEERHKPGTVNFSFSRLYFEKGEYDKAQKYLIHFDYGDMLQNIVAKTMLLKIYFEGDDLDAFESLLESMRTYLQRKEALDATRKLAYKNMISLMKKLLHLNIYSKAQRDKFRETVVKTNPLAEREWLLKQME